MKFYYILAILFTVSCTTSFLQVKDDKSINAINTNKEYDQFIEVKEYPKKEEPTVEKVKAKDSENVKLKKKSLEKKSVKKKKLQKKTKTLIKTKKVIKKKLVAKKKKRLTKVSKAKKRQPENEDNEGFIGRRPQVDPFRVGEQTTLALTYFNVSAGYMDLKVLPFKEVNGQRSYHYQIKVRSSKVFSYVYSVEDTANTFVNYEDLRPYNFSLHIKESKQLKEIRSVHDWKKKEGYYWEKKITKEDGEKSKSKKWSIGEYTQNVVSAAFYLRNFTLTPGKNLEFQVADEGKNITFKGKVLRRETLQTDVGELKTIVLKPEISMDGVFKPIGDVLFWLTDDDRKFIVRIEAKIKIGTVVAKVKKLKRN